MSLHSFLQHIKKYPTTNPFFSFTPVFFHQQSYFPVGAQMLPILVFFLFRGFLHKQGLLPKQSPSETPFAKSQSWFPLQVTATLCGQRNNLCGSSLVSCGGFPTLPADKPLQQFTEGYFQSHQLLNWILSCTGFFCGQDPGYLN